MHMSDLTVVGTGRRTDDLEATLARYCSMRVVGSLCGLRTRRLAEQVDDNLFDHLTAVLGDKHAQPGQWRDTALCRALDAAQSASERHLAALVWSQLGAYEISELGKRHFTNPLPGRPA